MILVDSSVWIDYFRGQTTAETETLDVLLGRDNLLVGDLILAEVLQGFSSDRDFNTARKLLTDLESVALGSKAIALASARNYRSLRKAGITVRKTIDCIIATRCIEDGIALLYGDRDFDPFVRHLGLRSALQMA